jgi:CheY-like chemotaxis protein
MIITKPYNIFYADDDKDDQDLFKEAVLELKKNIHIFTQDNGAQLMLMLGENLLDPRLIFLDLNMPVKNGYDVLTEIRKSTVLKTLPVIIFSTSRDADVIALTQKLGDTMYIPKPNGYAH